MNLRSHVKLTSRASRRAGLVLVVLASLVPIGTAAGAVTQGTGCTDGGATVSCEFWAKSDNLSVPGGSVAVMGYAGTAADAPMLPGPTIVADAGDTVTVTLHNTLATPTGMLFQEQPVAPDLTGAPANVGTKTYTFTASEAGTYLYEASPFVKTSGGGGSQYQAAMGMSGALVVRPATPGQAYDSAGSAYDAEHLVVVSELDKDITAANAATFDMRNYAPDYFLVNGKASPDTATLPANAGDRVLLRWVDAGIKAHSVAVLGAGQRVVGEDGNALANPRDMVAETLGAGQTEDVIVTLSPNASGKLPVYDSGLWLNNNTSAGMGGALTFLDVTGSGVPTDTAGPGTTNVAFNLATGALTATVSDVATGGANVAAAEYFLDVPGAPASGSAMSGPFGSSSVGVSATVPFPAGPHTIYVRGQDSNGNWGPVSSIIVANDTSGPLTRSLDMLPNPSNGSKDVALKATGDDSATGGSNIVAGEYTIDGGASVALTPNIKEPIAALDTTITAATVAGLAEGSHGVSVRSQDSAGNWGAWATLALLKDTTGPSTGPVTSSYSANQQALLLTATVTDPSSNGVSSNVAAAEGFIDAVGANGTGFLLTPVDGAWSTGSEGVRGDVPLVTLAALSPGAHTIYLHGRDASGNWGPTSAASTNPLTPQSGANPLTLARSNVIFGTGFESTQAAATITGAGRLAFVPAANMAGTGRLGMRVTLSGEISPKTPVSAYVTDNSPAAESTYNARFYFNPNNSTPGGGTNGITILAGYTADDGRGDNRFDVSYRQKGSVRQVRLNVRSGRGIASTGWFTVPRASATSVEVSWQAERSAKVTLLLKGKVAQTLSGLDTGIRSRIESVRFGVQGLSRSTSGRRGTLYLDSFVSTRDGVVGP